MIGSTVALFCLTGEVVKALLVVQTYPLLDKHRYVVRRYEFRFILVRIHYNLDCQLSSLHLSRGGCRRNETGLNTECRPDTG